MKGVAHVQTARDDVSPSLPGGLGSSSLSNHSLHRLPSSLIPQANLAWRSQARASQVLKHVQTKSTGDLHRASLYRGPGSGCFTVYPMNI